MQSDQGDFHSFFEILVMPLKGGFRGQELEHVQDDRDVLAGGNGSQKTNRIELAMMNLNPPGGMIVGRSG